MEQQEHLTDRKLINSYSKVYSVKYTGLQQQNPYKITVRWQNYISKDLFWIMAKRNDWTLENRITWKKSTLLLVMKNGIILYPT